MFAASTAFMPPNGYKTNLFVYGPGGYSLGDFVRVGGSLHLICAVVTTVGIYLFGGATGIDRRPARCLPPCPDGLPSHIPTAESSDRDASCRRLRSKS